MLSYRRLPRTINLATWFAARVHRHAAIDVVLVESRFYVSIGDLIGTLWPMTGAK